MSTKPSNSGAACEDYRPTREYSRVQELIGNLPYMGMIVLGAIVFVVGLGSLAWGWIAASVYVIYGLAGIFWIIVFICPYCGYWNTKSCPCGYGRIAAKLRKKKPANFREAASPGNHFNEKFKKHILVIVPLWFIPILAGTALVVRTFSWTLLVLLVVFAVEAFVVLPLLSTKYSCRECPQRDSCPWMGRRCKPGAVLKDCERP